MVVFKELSSEPEGRTEGHGHFGCSSHLNPGQPHGTVGGTAFGCLGFTKQMGGSPASRAAVDQQLWCEGRSWCPPGEEHLHVHTSASCLLGAMSCPTGSPVSSSMTSPMCAMSCAAFGVSPRSVGTGRVRSCRGCWDGARFPAGGHPSITLIRKDLRL